MHDNVGPDLGGSLVSNSSTSDIQHAKRSLNPQRSRNHRLGLGFEVWCMTLCLDLLSSNVTALHYEVSWRAISLCGHAAT